MTQSGDFPKDPRKIPVPVPSTGIFDSPTVRICLNAEWAGHLDGLLGRLLEPDAWIGTDSEIESAIQQVGELMTYLALMRACSLCGEIEFRIVDDILQERCDGGEWTSLGDVRGPTGATGATGATGPQGPAGTTPTLPKRATMWHDEAVVINSNPLSDSNTTARYQTFTTSPNPANQDEFSNSFWLRAGTYTFSVLGVTANSYGKLEWYIDGTLAVSAQDWYSAATTGDVVKSATVTVATDGYHVLVGRVNGKNASSSNYRISLTKYWLAPAAD